jgi:hypothetical protein
MGSRALASGGLWVLGTGMALAQAQAAPIADMSASPQAAPVASGTGVASPEAVKAWAQQVEKRRTELITRNGSGTDKALAAQLMTMQETDQDARGISHGTPKNAGKTTTALNLNEVDAQLTEQLKAIVAKDGWPTIALVGLDASNAAMLILTHSRDHAWQASLLPQLETLADTGKIDGAALAVVIDKQLISKGQLQRYGTQFKYIDGGMAMYGVEDPANLDATRARIGLPPMAIYRAQLEGMYHLKPIDKVVMATPQPQMPAAPGGK